MTAGNRRIDSWSIDWRLVVAAVAVVAVALHLSPPLVAFAIIEVMIFALYASALNLLLSYSGMVSFGHAVYFGLGAYGLAITIAKFGWPIWAGIVAGPLVSAFFGLIYGALCVQLTAIYAAMLTLACAEITFAIVFQWFDFTGGDSGISGHVPAMMGLSPAWFGIVVLVVVTVCILALWRVVHTPLGLTIRAVGENPVRAAAMGHGRKRVQLAAFVISAFLSGVAGTHDPHADRARGRGEHRRPERVAPGARRGLLHRTRRERAAAGRVPGLAALPAAGGQQWCSVPALHPPQRDGHRGLQLGLGVEDGRRHGALGARWRWAPSRPRRCSYRPPPTRSSGSR